MKLIQQLIQKKIQNFDNKYLQGENDIWSFFQTIGFILPYLNHKIDKKKLNLLWNKALNNNQKSIYDLNIKVNENRFIINDILLIELDEEEDKMGNFDSEDVIGIPLGYYNG